MLSIGICVLLLFAYSFLSAAEGEIPVVVVVVVVVVGNNFSKRGKGGGHTPCDMNHLVCTFGTTLLGKGGATPHSKT